MLHGWEELSPAEEETIMRGVRDGGVYGGPYHLLLFPTDRCNLDCFFCYTDSLRRIAAELDWNILHRALEEACDHGLKGVSLGGGGESLIYRGIGPLLEFVHSRGLGIDSIKTNGTAITEAMADSLLRARLRRITVSLNETEPAEYARMNQCPERLFHQAMRGIGAMVEGKRRLGADCEVSVQVFVWRGNIARLPAMIATAMGTGADLVYVNTIDLLPESDRMNPQQRDELAATVRAAMAEHGDRLSLNLAGEGLQDVAVEEVYKAGQQLPDLTNTPDRIEYCLIGWHSPTITASGDVFPCCHFATDPSRTLGSLHDLSLQEIWTGRLARKYREEMRALMFAEADPALLPPCTSFIHKLCMGRSDCAFNYYLARPKVYMALHDWAEGGPRAAYKRRAALQNGLRARRGKGRARAAQACRQGRQVMTTRRDNPACTKPTPSAGSIRSTGSRPASRKRA